MAFATVYVHPTTGSDANPTPNIGTPYKTIKKACDNVAAQGTIFCRGGTYPLGESTGTILSGLASVPGIAGSPTTVKSYENEPAIWQCSTSQSYVVRMAGLSYITFEDLEFDGDTKATSHVVNIPSSDNITLRNCELHNGIGSILFVGEGAASNSPFLSLIGCSIHTNTASHGIYWNAGADGRIDGCKIYDTFILGMQINSYNVGSVPSDRMAFCNNRMWGWSADHGGIGLVVGHGADHLIYNNIFYKPGANGSRAIAFGFNGPAGTPPASTNARVLHNIIHDIDQGEGIGISFASATSGGTGHVVSNNLILDTNGAAISDPFGTSTATNNMTAYEGGDVDTDMFIDPGNATLDDRNYRHTPTSKAVDGAATALSGIVSVGIALDKDGVMRPQGTKVDAGAFELVQAASGLWNAGNQNTGSWSDSGFTAMSVRNLMKASAWDTSVVTAFKLVFRGRTDASYDVIKVSVVERDGSTLDGIDGTNQQLTFGGTWAAGGTVPQNGELYSDSVVYVLDHTKDYFITYYASASVGVFLTGGSGDTAWMVASDVAATIDWDTPGETIAQTRSYTYSTVRIEETTTPQDPESYPIIEHLGSYAVTPGTYTALATTLSDVNDDITQVTALSTKTGLKVTGSGAAVIDIYTG